MQSAEFLAKLNRFTDSCTEDQLRKALKIIAETIQDEEQQWAVLLKLNALFPAPSPVFSQNCSLAERHQHLARFLESVSSQERRLVSLDGDEIPGFPPLPLRDSKRMLYELWYDPDQILPAVEEGCRILHQDRTEGRLELAASLGWQLLNLTVSTNNISYAQTLFDLQANYALSINPWEALQDTLFALYSLAEEDRISRMYQLLSLADKGLKQGAQLPPFLGSLREGSTPDTFSRFLQEWIRWLGTQPSPLARQLLLDAVDCLPDPAQRLDCAHLYYNLHPVLYVHLMEDDTIPPPLRIDAGLSALPLLPKHAQERESVALLTAELMLQQAGANSPQDDQPNTSNTTPAPPWEECWLEAFITNPRPLNLLRLLVNCRSPQAYHKPLHQYLARLPQDAFNATSHHFLEVLCGDFEAALDEMGNEEARYFVRISPVYALLFLVLWESTSLPPGMEELLDLLVKEMDFQTALYQIGLPLLEPCSDRDVLWEVLQVWKTRFPISRDLQLRMRPYFQESIPEWVRRLPDFRLEETVPFLAAWGELLEQWGAGSKQDFLTDYVRKYPHRKVFRKKLEQLGWTRVSVAASKRKKPR